ncbi:MAG: superfamily [Streptosporangiaceae bacterium]|nr:superfamily [Streptosporangiaceae bacterium]
MSTAKTATADRATEPAALEILNVHEAIARAKAECSPVGKGDRNTDQNFNFRGIDSVLNGTARALNHYGVTFAPEVRAIQTDKYESRRGSSMMHVLVTVAYHVRGADGTSLDHPLVVIGESADAGDKAVSKAMSVAFRTVLIQLLNLPTGDPDPDSEAHERAPRSASEAFEQAQPAPPRGQQGNGNGHRGNGNGQRGGPANGAQRPANGHANGNGNGQPQRPRMAPQPPLEPDDDWKAKVDELATPDEVGAAEAELRKLYEDGQVTTERANQILYAIRQRADALAGHGEEPANEQPGAGAPAEPAAPAQPVPDGDSEWVADFLVSVANAQSSGALDGLKQRIGPAIVSRKITPDAGAELAAEVLAKRKELQGVDA